MMEATALEQQLLQLAMLWRQGEAVRQDPVLANMSARLTAGLNRTAPGLAARVQAALAPVLTRSARPNAEL